jgi:hypothetical protein
VREIVGKIAEQTVDKLYKIVALVCRNSDQIIKNLVIAFRMKLRLDGCDALGLGSLEAYCVPDDSWGFRSRHGRTIPQCTAQ